MTEPDTIKELFDTLLAKPLVPFPAPRARLIAPKERGVYIIRDKAGRVMHVGNTPRSVGGLTARLKSHLAGKSSFVNVYLGGDASRLRGGFTFQVLEVPAPRTRALLEAYAIGCLCPRHVGKGQLKTSGA